jgi:large subunit ribosomal protein L17
MKKNVYGRKFKRDKNERKALFKSLMSALVMHERIQISEAKAKAIKPEIEKLVTKAKQGGNAAKLVIEKNLTRDAFERIIKEIAPRFDKRQGGYTRLIKLGERFGDNSPVVVMEWTEVAQAIVPVEVTEKAVKTKKTEKVEKTIKKSDSKVKDVGKLTTVKKSSSAKSSKARKSK